MTLRRNALVLFVNLALAAHGADKNDKFTPPPADQMAKQTISGVTLYARAFDTEDLCKPAFGKVNPNRFHVLPVWVRIENDSKRAVKIDGAVYTYIDLNKAKIEATPAAEVKYAKAPERPNMAPRPLPIPRGRAKNPLDAFEIESRALAAKMLPPGESAQGFIYFQTGHRGGATLFVTGFRDAASGEDLFYFEIPLDATSSPR
jgi:hypothetical protein